MATHTDSGGIWFPIVDNDFYYSTQPFHSNEWQMITITRNTTHTRIFINGIWDNTLPESHFGGNTRFGGNPNNDRWIDGWVDEVAVWSKELTEQEAIDYHNSFANEVYLYENFEGNGADGLEVLPKGWSNQGRTGTFAINELATREKVYGMFKQMVLLIYQVNKLMAPGVLILI